MIALLRWAARDGTARFIAVTPLSQAEEFARTAANAVSVDGEVRGSLDRRAAEWLATHAVQSLQVYSRDRRTVVVDGSWDRAGVWLAPEQVNALNEWLRDATPRVDVTPSPLGWIRAQVLLHALFVERTLAFIVGFGLVFIFNDALANVWDRTAVLLGGMLGAYGLAWLIRTIWASRQTCL